MEVVLASESSEDDFPQLIERVVIEISFRAAAELSGIQKARRDGKAYPNLRRVRSIG